MIREFIRMIKTTGSLPRASMVINGNEISYSCSYEKTLYESSSSLSIVGYEVTCQFEDALPLYNVTLENSSEIKEKKTITLYFPIIGNRLTPPRELLTPIEIYRKDFEKHIEEIVQNGGYMDREYYQELLEADYDEFMTEFTFYAEKASNRMNDWNDGYTNDQIDRLYADLSPKQLEEQLLLDDIYWMMKKVVGSTRMVKVNKDRSEIIGGPF